MESLRKKADFSKTYRFGKQFRTTNFTIKALQTNTEVLKLAIVIPKSVSKKAVVRNRARRRVREIIKKNSALAATNYFVIVNVYSDLSGVNAVELEKIIVESFQKLHIFSS